MTPTPTRRRRAGRLFRVSAAAALLLLPPVPGLRGEGPPPPVSSREIVPVLRAAGRAVPGPDGVGIAGPPVVPLVPLWRAETAYQDGRAVEALKGFLELAYDYGDDERKGFVWLRVGEILLARGETAQALEAAERAAILSRARYLVLAAADLKYRIHVKRRQGAEARDLAAYLLRQRYLHARPAELLAAMARADGEAGQVALALSEFRQAIEAAADEPDFAERLRWERDLFIDGLADLPALREAGEVEEDPGVRALLWLTLGTAAKKKGLPGLAAFAYERAVQAGGRRGEEAAGHLAALEGAASGRAKVVGLLPLSGSRADIGFAVLSGAEVALREIRRTEGPRPAPLLRWVDTAGQPDRARARFLEAGADPSVVGFIGPLTGEEGYSVSVAAGPASPPVLYLGQKGIPEKPFVYPFGLTPSQEARILLAHLARSGQRELLVFFPENGYGRGFAEAIAQAAGTVGVRVAKSVSYPPETTDFTPVIRKAVGEKAFSRYARLKERGKAMELPFRAVVIADHWDRVFLLASQLRHYNVYLPLAGFSGWNDGALLRKAGDAVNGSVFPADYTEAVTGPQGDLFRRGFREVMGISPGRFEAMGFDGASFLAAAFGLGPWEGEGSAAEAMRGRIAALGSYVGVTGTFEFGPAGDLRRRVPLLRIDFGTLVPVPGA